MCTISTYPDSVHTPECVVHRAIGTPHSSVILVCGPLILVDIYKFYTEISGVTRVESVCIVYCSDEFN